MHKNYVPFLMRQSLLSTEGLQNSIKVKFYGVSDFLFWIRLIIEKYLWFKIVVYCEKTFSAVCMDFAAFVPWLKMAGTTKVFYAHDYNIYLAFWIFLFLLHIRFTFVAARRIQRRTTGTKNDWRCVVLKDSHNQNTLWNVGQRPRQFNQRRGVLF